MAILVFLEMISMNKWNIRRVNQQSRGTDGCIITALAFSSIFCASLHQQLAYCMLYGVWPWPTFLGAGWRHAMKHPFFFFFFFKGCIRAAKSHFPYNPKDMCLCLCVCTGTLLLQVLALMAHSAATWTVQAEPNFSTNANWHPPFAFPLPHRHSFCHWSTDRGWKWWMSEAITGGFFFFLPCLSWLSVCAVRDRGTFPQTASFFLALICQTLPPRLEKWRLKSWN